MRDAVEVAILEEHGSTGFHVWAAYREDRARHRVPNDDHGIIQGEAFVEKVEALIQGGSRVSEQEMAELGNGLFGMLFRGESLRLYQRLSATEPVSLVIISSDARVLNLPWEYFHESTQPLGPNILRPVVRAVPTVGLSSLPPRPSGDPVQILLVAAEPLDQVATDWQRQEALIRSDFEAFLPGSVELHVERTPTRRVLGRTLQDTHYDVVHFVGHGENGALTLVDDANNSDCISANDFTRLLVGRQIRMVVLAACRTGGGAFERDFSVVAPSLVRGGIPAVIAMQYSVPARTATEYVGTFYHRLLHNAADLDTAAAEGRLALAMNLGSNAVEWGIPVLYRSLGATNPFAEVSGHNS